MATDIAQAAIVRAEGTAKHATDELDRVGKGGILDEARLIGIRSELLSAALALTQAIYPEDVFGRTVEALQDVSRHGPGYPI